MINRAVTREPVADWQIPKLAQPKLVVETDPPYRAVSGQKIAADEEVRRRTRAGLEEARAADRLDLGTALREGRELSPEEDGRHEREAIEALARATRRRDALREVVDEAGNALADAVLATRSTWIADLEAAAEAHKQKALALLAQVGEELRAAGHATASATWLSRLDEQRVKSGRERGFHGGSRLELPVEVKVGRGEDVGVVVQALTAALLPQPERPVFTTSGFESVDGAARPRGRRTAHGLN